MHSLLSKLSPRVALVSAAVLVLGWGAFRLGLPERPRYWKQGYVHFVESEGYLYSFDAALRVVSMRPAPEGDRAVALKADAGPVREARLRRALLANLGLPSLESVPVEGTRELESLRSMGYL